MQLQLQPGDRGIPPVGVCRFHLTPPSRAQWIQLKPWGAEARILWWGHAMLQVSPPSLAPPSSQWIQLQLWERHGLRALRRTLNDLASQVGGGTGSGHCAALSVASAHR